MTIRMILTGGVIASTLMLAACHKSDEAGTNEVNAAAELANMADINATDDTNANDEMMNEDSGNQALSNAG